MSIITKIKSFFSSTELAKIVLRKAISEGSNVAGAAVTTVLITHGITVPQDVVTEIVSTVISKVEDAL